MKSISVIIPVFNEKENISPVYSEVSSVLNKLKMKYEIIFVNDGSTDGTLKEIVKLNKKDSRVKVIDFKKNFGQSAAMQAGFDNAIMDLICYIDGDMQIDFSELPLFLKEIEKGSDAAVGFRHKRKDNFFKNTFSKIARFLRKKTLGTDLCDYGCPFKVFTSESIKSIKLFGEMHRYIPPMLKWNGYTTTEVKISHRPRIHGTTKYNIFRVYKGFIDMFNIWFWQKYSARPLHIFGGIGVFSIISSLILGLVLIYLRLGGKLSLVNSTLPMFTGLLFLSGIIFFCFGLIADMLSKIYYSTEQKKTYTIRKIYK